MDCASLITACQTNRARKGTVYFLELGDPGNLTIQKRRRSCRNSTRKPRSPARQLRLVRCFAQCRYRSNVRQYQALFCLLTKRKPALVIRAVQLVLQESIGAIGVRHGAARQASPASGPPVISPAAKIWGVEVRRYPSTFANPPKIRLDGRRSEAQPRSIGHPAHRYDRKCRLVRRKRCKGLFAVAPSRQFLCWFSLLPS
jgi:hypothetical protein